MKLAILLITFSLFFAGCASTTTKPKSDSIIPYQYNKSVAWNVMNQVEAAGKLKDVEAPSQSSIDRVSTASHITFALLSNNFFSGLGTSLILDNDGEFANEPNLIFAVELPKNSNQNLKLLVAKHLADVLKKRNPDATFKDFVPYDDGYEFKEYSKECYETFGGKNEFCRVIFSRIDIVAPANRNLFDDSENKVTVLVQMKYRYFSHFKKFINRVPKHFINYMPDAYLFHRANEYSRQRVDGKVKNMGSTPIFIEKNNIVHFFYKPDTSKKIPTITLDKMPHQQLLQNDRTSKISEEIGAIGR
jgi:hypothetical protein